MALRSTVLHSTYHFNVLGLDGCLLDGCLHHATHQTLHKFVTPGAPTLLPLLLVTVFTGNNIWGRSASVTLLLFEVEDLSACVVFLFMLCISMLSFSNILQIRENLATFLMESVHRHIQRLGKFLQNSSKVRDLSKLVALQKLLSAVSVVIIAAL